MSVRAAWREVRAGWREVRAGVVQSALLAGALLVLLLAAHRRAPVPAALAVSALVVLVGHVLARLPPAPEPLRAALRPAPPTTTVDTGTVAVEWSLDSVEHVNRVLRPRLARLAADRLAQRHGVALDQPRARRLLGEQLWGVLTVPATRPPTAAELSAALTSLEQL